MTTTFSLLLGGQTFQLFHDHKPPPAFNPAQVHDTFDNCADKLHNLNEEGYGVYYTVNLTKSAEKVNRVYPNGVPETAGWSRKPGRTADDITRVRAWYADIDGIPNPRIKRAVIRDLLTHTTAPSAIIETKNGLYALWYAWPDQEYDAEEYRRTEIGIINYWGGDKNAKDVARVLRVPGFWHQKDPEAPFLVTLRHEEDLRYSPEELQAAFPPPAKVVPRVGYRTRGDAPDSWREVCAALYSWNPQAGVRHNAVLIALGVAIKFGIPNSQAVFDLEPIVTGWDTGRDMGAELRRAAAWAFNRGEPASVAALRNIGVDIPRLKRPE